MNIKKLLCQAGVPESLHADAIASLAEARRRSRGLSLKKVRTRIFNAGKIAKALAWEDERLCLKRPDMADHDIAPMRNITSYGDTLRWEETPEGGRPCANLWLDKNVESDDYKDATEFQRKYYGGLHPRSRAGRAVWYRRNGGEYLAWRLGVDVAADDLAGVYKGPGIEVHRRGSAWLLKRAHKVLGVLWLETRAGFEVDNLFSESGQQLWFPIPRHALRAPVTWSVLPRTRMPIVGSVNE